MNNPAFELVEDLSWGLSVGGRFVGPASFVSFRSKRMNVSPESRAKKAEALRKARAARRPVSKQRKRAVSNGD
jgi:hypothetical protein